MPSDWLDDWYADPDYGPLLALLTPEQAAVTALILEGFSQRETAAALGISYQAVRRRKCRAKRRLGEIRAVCHDSRDGASHIGALVR